MLPITLTAALQALGYCAPDPWVVWPPPETWLPITPRITAFVQYGAPATDLVLTDGERRVPLRVTEIAAQGAWELVPAEPLTAGTWHLLGAPEAASWTVREATPEPPRWAGEPAVRDVSTIDFLCAEGPWITLDVPLAGAERQPLVDVAVTVDDLPDQVFHGRYRVEDDRVLVYQGCAPVAPIDPGDGVTLTLTGVDSLGRRTSSKTLSLVAPLPAPPELR